MTSGQAIDTESISHRRWLRAPAVAPAAGSENKEKHALGPSRQADPRHQSGIDPFTRTVFHLGIRM
jgi:hypothetical protein